MKYLIIAFTILLTSCNKTCIFKVTDGDTVEVVGLFSKKTIRITGIDAPELYIDNKRNPAGWQSYEVAKNLLEYNCYPFIRGTSIVTGDHIDHYGRYVGDFKLPNGLTFGEYMIKHGYAKPIK